MRQSANRAQRAKEAARPKSADARQPLNSEQQALGNQAVQRLLRAPAAGGGDVPPVRPELEQSLHTQRGGGEPLSPDQRAYFEPRFGRDLSRVRLHTDQQASAAARELGADAFTHGQDIYFGAGRYQPHSDAGRRLVAHELTHTLQQSPQVHRANGTTPAPPAGGAPAAAMTPETGVLDEAAGKISFDKIEVPAFKLQDHRGQLYGQRKPLKQKKAYARGEPDQRAKWKEEVGKNTGGVVTKLEERYKKATASTTVDPAQQYVFQSPPGGPPRYFIGNLQSVAQEMTLPTWTRGGKYKTYDVDHIVELQLANWDEDQWANTLENMELLESGLNRSSGSTIKGNIDKKLGKFIETTNKQYGSSASELKSKYALEFAQAVGSGGKTAGPDDYWKKDQIEKGDQVLDSLRVVKASDLGGDGKVVVFPTAGGGVPKQFTWPGGITGDEKTWLKPYEITAKNFNTEPGAETSDQFGSLTFVLPPDHKDWYAESGAKDIPVKRIPGAQYAGSIDKSAVRGELSKLRKKGLSPVEIGTFDILPGQGVYFSGTIKPDIPLLEGVAIDFEFSGGELTLSKEFAPGDFKVPKPFVIHGSTLKVSVGTGIGLQVDGQVDFGIERVGDGYLKGTAGTSAGFSLEGGFTFDTKLFTKAEAKLGYADKKLSASGELAIGPDKVKGIKSASVIVSYANEEFKASGSAELSVPGVKKGTMEVVYKEAEGLAIGGKFDLADNIPGVRGGSVEAKVKQTEGGWDVTASITAQPAIPGFNTTLTGTYENGVITVQAEASFARGLMSGTILAGATNRAVDETGKPTGEAGETLTAFGGGSVTVKLTPWLQGTVGVMIKPDGGVKLMGEVALPSTFELFPQKKVEKNIFSIGIDIPIVGVAVAGQRIGIFATIKGGLDATASFGPGQLRNTKVSLTYDPDNEAATELTGTAQFYVPAQAGLRLFVRGGLGVGIPIVSATANLEVGGQLGIEGAAEANVDVSWTPSKGVTLDAEAKVSAQPTFKFDVTGKVLVEADLLLTTITLYEQSWQLASFEYGSDLRFGISFPIHYEEGTPFDVKLDDVKFEIPEVDPSSILSDLVAKLA